MDFVHSPVNKRQRKERNLVRRYLIGIALLFVAVAHADIDHGSIHYRDGLVLTEQDIEVQARYGKVRFAREYDPETVTGWVWNKRWTNLTFDLDAEDGAVIYRGDDPFSGGTLKSGSRWRWGAPQKPASSNARSSSGGGGGGSGAVAPDYGTQLMLIASARPSLMKTDTGFRWQAFNGEWINYNEQGAIQSYGQYEQMHARFDLDSENRIVRVYDHAENLILTITYSGAGAEHPSLVEDYSGRSVRYAYDASGKLSSVYDVRGKQWRYSYHADGRLSGYFSPNGRVAAYSYDSGNYDFSIVTADGLEYGYVISNVASEPDLNLLLEYRPDGTLVETIYAEGVSNRAAPTPTLTERVLPLLYEKRINDELVTRQYSSTLEKAIPNDYRSLSEDAAGNQIYTVRDLQGRLQYRQYADGTKENWRYIPNTNLLMQHTNRNGVVTERSYDSQSRLTEVIEAVGTSVQRSTSYTYPDDYSRIITHSGPGAPDVIWEERLDAFGNVIERIDPEQHATHYTYNVLGQVLTETLPEGGVYRYEYDEAGNLLRREDPIGRVTEFRYDDVGNRVWQKLPNEGEFHFEYNAMNERIATVNPLGHRSTVAFDRQTREEVRTDEEGNVTRLRKNPMGLPELSVDGGGNTIRMNWKGFHLESVNYPTFSQEFEYRHGTLSAQKDVWEGRERRNRFVQSPLGELLEQHDALNNPTRNRYDELGRLIQITDAEGGVIRLDYDHRDNLLQVTDPENRITRFEYDRIGQVTAEIRTPEPGQENRRRYSYDRNGNLKEENTPNGERRIHHYDLANQLTSMESYASGASVSERTTVLAYNALGQISGYSDGQTEGFYEYDLNGRVIELITDFGPFSKTQAYTYYRNGLKKTYTNAEGITYTYTYNGNNQLTGIHIPGHGQLSYSNYQWLVPQSQQLPGGAEISLSYDGLLQLQERRLRDPASNELASAAYEFDLVSNIRRINTEHGEYQFDYDALYRLTNAEYPTGVAANDEDFGYDGVGNRVRHTRAIGPDAEPETVTATYNDANQLLETDAGAVFTYNANGHTESKTQNGQVTEYRYNSTERLVAVKINGEVVGQYAFNPFGHRIRKTANGQTTWYLYNEEGLAAEYDVNGNLVKEYHFKPYGPWMTEPLFQRTAEDDVFYYQNDHLGSPQRVINGAGSVVWEVKYGAFGDFKILIEIADNSLRFPGQYYDVESGLYHNYHRDYDVFLGRYLQADPIGFFGGINLYIYGNSNPVNNIDPDGLRWYDILGIIRTVEQVGRFYNRAMCGLAFFENRRYSRSDQIFHDEIDRFEREYQRRINKCDLDYSIVGCESTRRLCYDQAADSLGKHQDRETKEYEERNRRIGEDIMGLRSHCDPTPSLPSGISRK